MVHEYEASYCKCSSRGVLSFLFLPDIWMSLSSLSSSLPALSLSIALFIYVLQGTGYRTLSIVYPAPFRYIIFLHITTTHTHFYLYQAE